MYIQGFVVPVVAARKDDYVAAARRMVPILRDYGAVRLVETWGVDLPEGKATDFRRAVQATAEENVAFSWIVWPDKATCDAAAKRMMTDERMQAFEGMPFDMGRMIFGGFEPILDTED